MTWGHKHKPQDQLQGQALQQQQQGLQMPPQPPLQAASPQEAETNKRAHWQERLVYHALPTNAFRTGGCMRCWVMKTPCDQGIAC